MKGPPSPILVFEVAGHLCGLPAGDVRELVFLPELTVVPGQPAVIEGFLNLRGNAIPVTRLDRLFELGEPPLGLWTVLIVAGEGDDRMALAVDRVAELASPEEVRPVAGGHSFNDCAAGEFDTAGGGATLLDSRRVLLEKERRCVEDLRKRAQALVDSLEAPAV